MNEMIKLLIKSAAESIDVLVEFYFNILRWMKNDKSDN